MTGSENTTDNPRSLLKPTAFPGQKKIRIKDEQKAKAIKPPALESMTREETQQMVHEMQVKQLETEIYIDYLRSDLEKTKDILNGISNGVWSLTWSSFDVVYINTVTEEIYGRSLQDFHENPSLWQDVIHPEDQHMKRQAFEQLREKGVATREFRIFRPDGSIVWIIEKSKLVYDKCNTPVRIEGICSDITERKQREYERDLIACFLAHINTPGELREKISALIGSLQVWSGCEAIGIRMREGNDFPYYATCGFPPAFIQAENYLCAYGPDGKILLNGMGNPVLECMCGNVLSGSFDHSKPFFTAQGSFWTNSTSALLASTTKTDRKGRTRNRCNGEGYESVALVPLRSGNMIFGLLQFNDRRPGRFTSEQITHFENIADNLAIGLAQRKAEEALRRSENYYRAIFETSGAAMFISEDDTTISLVNSNFVELSGYSRQEIEGKKSWTEFVHPDDVAWMKENHYLRRQNPDAAPRRYEFRLITRNEEMRHILLGVDRIPESDQSIASCIDITERRKADEKIRYLSFHDSLTGLYNRAYLEEEMKRLNTERQLPIGVIMVDLNGLKLVNDTYGHAAGDKMLNAAAGVLRKSCRKEDIIARWGGDEFVILLPQIRAEDESSVCKRIKDQCSKAYVENVQLSMALGLSIMDRTEKGLETTLKEAEDYMYQQKFAQGRSNRGNVLCALLKILREKNFETEEHTRNIQNVALKIARKKGLSDLGLSRLHLLISFHDIGKINLPGKILTKKEPLTDYEWQIIKKHPEIGHRIARATVEFAHLAEDILAHHEHWDGSGYPLGLQGKKISLLARITSIADAYAVMANGRPYKKAMPKEKIIAELKRCSGTQFDPVLVEILLSVLDEETQARKTGPTKEDIGFKQ